MTVGQLKNIISMIPDDVEIEGADTWKFMDLPKVSIRGVNKPGQEMPEVVDKVRVDMDIIDLLRKLLTATWDYNIAHRKHMGVLVEDVLNFLIDAMEAELKKEEQEDEKNADDNA